MNKSILLLLLPLIFAFAVQTSFKPSKTAAASPVEDLLDTIISITKTHSIYTSQVDWSALTREMKSMIAGKDSLTAVIEPVETMFEALGDFHGGLYFNNRRYNRFFKTEYRYPVSLETFNKIYEAGFDVKTAMLDHRIAYIKIPPVEAFQIEDVNRFTAAIREKVCALKAQNPSGWIIDLRANPGGNMYPMFTGLGELFPNLNLGGDSKDGKIFHSNWYTQDGNFFMWDSPMTSLPLQCNEQSFNENERTRIAVLAGRYTVSSGEAVASAFKGQKNFRLFGEITSGWSSTTGWFPLGENIILSPTVAYFMSIDSTLHQDGILPDELIVEDLDHAAMTSGKTIEAAMKWIVN